MTSISAIEAGRRKGRFNVYVDGAFAVAVGERVLADLMLRVGQPFDPERLKKVAEAEEAGKALEAALRSIELRARSSKEIERRLREKGFEDGVITGVLEKLAQMGLIDDADFARQWVDSRNRSRPKGARLLRSELAQKGVSKDEIEEAVSHVTTESEAELARRALAPKVGRRALPTAKLERRAEYQRLAAFLQRRGFGWDAIKTALGEAFGQTSGADSGYGGGGGDDDDFEGERLGANDGDGDGEAAEPRIGSLDGAFGADDDSAVPNRAPRLGRRPAGSPSDAPYERRLGAMDGDASVAPGSIHGKAKRIKPDTGDE